MTPWKIGECVYGEYDDVEHTFTRARGYLLTDAKGNHVAIVMGADKEYSERTPGAANARLLVAAPEMRMLLESMIADFRPEERVNLARALLAWIAAP